MKNRNVLCLVLLAAFAVGILSREIELGPCYLQFLEPCANNSIQFFLFSSDTPNDEPVLLDNISPNLELDGNQTASKTFKMIIHGYGGHLDFSGSKQIRNGNLGKIVSLTIHKHSIASIRLSSNLPFLRHSFSDAYKCKLRVWDSIWLSQKLALRVRVKSTQAENCDHLQAFNFQLAGLLSSRFTVAWSDEKILSIGG